MRCGTIAVKAESLSLYLWLCYPVVLFSFVDMALTLAGQSPEFWAGDSHAVREANPIARVILQFHPVALVGFTVVSTGLFCGLIVVAPLRLAQAFAFFPAFLHAVAAAGWLTTYGALGWVLAVALLVLSERFIHHSWRRAGLSTSRNRLSRFQSTRIESHP